MNIARITPFLTAAALLLTACKGQDETAAAAAAGNPLLSYVPANTPYLLANLEPTPAAVVDAYLERFGPALALAQGLLDDIRIEVRADGESNSRHARLVAAVMGELNGKLNREGLESLGLSLESHKALYAMGVFPVLRLALLDAGDLRAAIGRIETAADMTFPSTVTDGAEYWRLSDDRDRVGLYIAILADHVAVSGFPVSAEAELLPSLLGQTIPEESIARNRSLEDLNQAQGFTPYASGYVDFRQLAAEFLDRDSLTVTHLKALPHHDTASLDPVCVAEIKGMIAKAPRLVMGTTELTANSFGFRYQMELEEGLAGQLARLVSDVPVADERDGRLLAGSLALQAGRLREFLLERATAMTEEPFECATLAGMNQAARAALEQMNRPMPPFIGNLNGFRIALDKANFHNPSPATTEGMFVLEVEKPQMLVGMAQMFIPGVEELNLEPGADPVELPHHLMMAGTEGMHVYAAMSTDAIGIALGAAQQNRLADFLALSGDNAGAFLSVSYDMAAHMELQSTARDRIPGMTKGGHGDMEGMEEFSEMMAKLREIENSYRDMLGRARLEMRFTDTGLVIDNHLTFK